MAPEVVVRSIVVRCSVPQAFEVFTARLDHWWPKTHSRSGDPDTTVLLEPWQDGRLYERTSGGGELAWGRVILWDPPHHLAYHWYLGSSSAQPTRVDVRFSDIGGGQTRVDVTHRGPELIGEPWERNSAIYAASWDQVLAAYAVRCAA